MPRRKTTAVLFIQVMSRIQAENYNWSKQTAIVSITDPDSVPARIETDHIVRESFWDIDKPILDKYPIEAHQASNIASFVRSMYNMNKIRSFVVHCEAGISRSPAVALAIAEELGAEDRAADLIIRYPYFNRKVYREMHKAFNRGK